jgi:hypothetical protein
MNVKETTVILISYDMPSKQDKEALLETFAGLPEMHPLRRRYELISHGMLPDSHIHKAAILLAP